MVNCDNIEKNDLRQSDRYNYRYNGTSDMTTIEMMHVDHQFLMKRMLLVPRKLPPSHLDHLSTKCPSTLVDLTVSGWNGPCEQEKTVILERSDLAAELVVDRVVVRKEISRWTSIPYARLSDREIFGVHRHCSC